MVPCLYTLSEYALIFLAFMWVDNGAVRVFKVIGAKLSESIPFRRQAASSRKKIIARETNVQRLDDTLEVATESGCGKQAMADLLYFTKAGIETIIDDDVTVRFTAAKPPTWNLLTRTSYYFNQFKLDWKIYVLWALGLCFRYLVMFPLRLIFFLVGVMLLVSMTTLIGLLPDGRVKLQMNGLVTTFCYQVLARSISAQVHFHDRANRTSEGGICVANHTSPLDVCILATDGPYSLTGQCHTGFLGFMQRTMSRANCHIWFDRNEAKQRGQVLERLKEHVENRDKLPILIFPEGTCINNTSVMMFKKGAFEVSKRIYPIAMKYDCRYGDAFWNSTEHSYVHYLLRMMTSWAIVCHVWYLPPVERMEGESAIDFANRVKRAIAKRAGLEDLEWDGQLKRTKVPPQLVAKVQQGYYRRLQPLISSSISCVPAKKARKLTTTTTDKPGQANTLLVPSLFC